MMFNTSVQNKSGNNEPDKGTSSLNLTGDSITRTVEGCPSVLTDLSREMRTQMNAIVAYSFLINKKEYSDSDRIEFTEQIHFASEQIINLFDNFLDSAVLDNGNLTAEPGKLNPSAFFNELFAEFKTILGRYRYRDILFVSEVQEFDPVIYITDVNKLARVIRNLFHHALSNTKSGYIKAGIKLKNDRLIFSILDSGYGFLKSKEFLQTKDLSESLAKTGDIYAAANMSLTLKLVKILDGMIWIERNGLAGSGIYFSIPAIEATNRDNKLDKYSNTMITI
jgi:signal transduction histidine kinase